MNPARDAAGDRLPAPIAIAIVLLAGWLLQSLTPLPALAGPARWIAGTALIVLGLLPGLVALRQMLRARTSPVPFVPTTAFLTGGMYRFSRNPMYAGMVLVVGGLAILLALTWSLVLLPVFVLLVHVGSIVPEERYLERRFGDEFRAYRRRVRPWI